MYKKYCPLYLEPIYRFELCGRIKKEPGGRTQRVYVTLWTEDVWWKLWTWCFTFHFWPFLCEEKMQ